MMNTSGRISIFTGKTKMVLQNVQKRYEEKDLRFVKEIKMKLLKKILNWFMLLLGAKSELTDEAVDAGICDFSGQGRDKYGK